MIVALVVGAHVFISRAASESHVLQGVVADRRKDIYTTVASISALVGGFATAAIAQYASSNGRDMRELRRRFGRSLRRNWSSILSGMLLLSAGCLFLLVIDKSKSIGEYGWLAEALLVLGAARAVRLVWLFNMLINVSDRDAVEPERSPALQFRSGD
ncbi:hypothetical protein ACFWV1_15845 [Streptomyces sp. NPDC058700]|uniref:hypothetical protein n=1 Tax=unclassified Streptomyces TaxID=2593676 RepID=UPI0036468F3A